MSDRSCRYQPPPPPPPHRRKTPSFSSSLLDSILRSIDETTDGDHTLHHLQQQQQHHDHDLMFFASEPKRSTAKLHAHYINNNQQQQQQMPSLRRAIIIDQWIDQTQNNNNSSSSRNRNNGYAVSPAKSTCATKLSSDSSSSTGTTMLTTSSASSPSTYRSLPNSFTISRNTAEAVFLDDTQNTSSSNKRQGTHVKFIKSTKLRAMKIYGDLKKVKQPMSPATRISAFIYSLFASSSSKKAKIKESMQNFRSLKKSRSIKLQDATMTCTSFSRSSCMSKKHHSSSNTTHVKRSVRFYPENDTLNILDRKSTHQRTHSDSMPLPNYDQRRWFAEKNYTKNYKSFMVNIEDDDEDEDDEDDLFELEIVGGVGTGAYTQELPVFETTDLRKIRI